MVSGHPRKRENGPEIAAFREFDFVSQIGDFGVSNPESLRPHARKFPFCGDCRRRLGAMQTAARTP